jgi:hypothetical protein
MAYVVSHPIQYQAPLLRLLSQQAGLDLKVLFLQQSTAGMYFDSGFDRTIWWDVPLLGGYAHETLDESKRVGGVWHSDLATRLTSGNFQIVWVHGYAHPACLRAIHFAHRRGIKVLLSGESNNLIPSPNPVRRFVKKRPLRWCLSRCSAFLCIGELNRDFYLRNGVSQDRLFDMPYAVDNAFFQQRVAQASHREVLRNSLSLALGRPVILYAGKLQEHKAPRICFRRISGSPRKRKWSCGRTCFSQATARSEASLQWRWLTPGSDPSASSVFRTKPNCPRYLIYAIFSSFRREGSLGGSW